MSSLRLHGINHQWVPSYRERVSIVVIVDVKQHHRAPGGPAMKVSFVLHKLQHKNVKNQSGHLRLKALRRQSQQCPPAVNTVILQRQVAFHCRWKF